MMTLEEYIRKEMKKNTIEVIFKDLDNEEILKILLLICALIASYIEAGFVIDELCEVVSDYDIILNQFKKHGIPPNQLSELFKSIYEEIYLPYKEQENVRT